MRHALTRTATAIGLAVGVGLFTGQSRTTAELRGVLDRAEPHLVRQLTMDRLSGKELSAVERSWVDSLFEAAHSEGSPGSVRIMWVIEAARCPGCLADVSVWNQLSADPAVSTLLVIAGETPGEAARIGESARVAGPVTADPSGMFGSLLRLNTPSTRLVIKDGTILLADGRNPLQGCSWTAEELVAALIGST